MKDNISFHFQKNIDLKNRTALKVFLAKMARLHKKDIEDLSVVFCSDQYLLKINKLYLNHHYFTDIITFDYSERKGKLNGELFISIDRVKDNASEFGKTIKNELHRVIFHGVLHLLGFNDKKPSEKKKIRLQEDQWLSMYFK